MKSHFRIFLSLVAALLLPASLLGPAAADQSIKVGGTTNLAPLVAQAAKDYQSTHAGVSIAVKGNSSGAGIAALKDRQVDIAMSDVAVNDADFADTIIGVVGFAFVVNPDTGIKNLTREELVQIFAGKITNWKEIGGNDRKIVLIGREIGTGTRFVFEDKVAKTLIPIQIESNASKVIDAVAKTSGSLGYAASGFIGDRQDLVVTYEGVQPSPSNIRDHLYAFATDEHLYTLKNADPGVTAFVQYVKNDTPLLRANGVFQ
ncbi:MAG TPA: substrate-binding domain-containing protein [Candidatus Acidoferrales bacterium]|nr:substrate-binding domain-containing protein [Candidatus Acidoferrales bacterium]